jgi:hypothetical protein
MGAAGIDDRPATTGFHAGAKTVVAFPFELTGLKGSLTHDSSFRLAGGENGIGLF